MKNKLHASQFILGQRNLRVGLELGAGSEFGLKFWLDYSMLISHFFLLANYNKNDDYGNT